MPVIAKDQEGDAQEEQGVPAAMHARSVLLSDDSLGVIARIDLVEAEGRLATPVDYKHGKAPDVWDGVWEPERVQICIQGLLLRANGYTCTEGVLYYVESHHRVSVTLDDALVSRTLELLAGTKDMAASGRIPDPLVIAPNARVVP